MNERRPISPAERFRQLWRSGQTPDLEAFLVEIGPLDPKKLAGILRVDQAARWLARIPIPAEEYLRRFPTVASDRELAIGLILNEYLLAEGRGPATDPDEFIRRFSDYADALRPQIDRHRAMTSRPAGDTVFKSQDTRTLDDAGSTEVVYKPAAADMSVAELPQPPLELPNPFGRYRILGVLGRGGMGAVYAAHDPHLDRRVALKVPTFGSADKEVTERFIREARIAAHFNDPHLCPVYEVGEIGGTFYLTMPVMEGQTLAERLRAAGRLPAVDAVRVVVAIARSMAIAHSEGVIHRDLKPANIFLSRTGQPIISDFGLAQQTTTNLADSAAGDPTIGTPAYMAPEQVNGDLKSIGPATDVYALGIVLYEMLTGTRPFDGPLGILLARIVSDEPKPPARIRPEIDVRLSEICCKAIAKQPADRYSSMAEFADALSSWLDAAVKPQDQRRHPIRPAIAVVAVLVLVAVALGTWRPWRHTPTKGVIPPPAASVVPDPDAAKARAELAWRLNNEGDLDRAVEESTGALRLDGRCFSALLCRGNALIKKNNPKGAVSDLLTAIEIDPTNPEAEVDLAWAYNELGEHNSALTHAARAVTLQPQSAEAHNQRGWARFKQGQVREAIADFTTAILYNPQYVWAYRNRALAYRKAGEEKLAANDEAKVAELNAAKKGM